MVDLQPGTLVGGKLRLVRLLGQGGMGSVWLAIHLGLDTEVAVKFIRPERAAADPSMLVRFEREAKAAARIASPHVVQIRDYGTVDDTTPYIVMELLRGEALTEVLLREGRLGLAQVAALVRDVGEALASAHAEGIVHRDVKPHNIFLTDGAPGAPDVSGATRGRTPGLVKVLDFGVAKIVSEVQVPGGSGLTETGTVIGSPPYMSPEQLEGRKDVDHRADLWSLAVVAYQALTGALPFEGGSFVSIGAAVLRGTYAPATALRPELPAALDDWFGKALSLDADRRYPSARELAHAFVALAREASESSDARDPRDATDVPAPDVPGRPELELAHASTVQQEAPVETPARALPAPPPDTAPRAGPLPAPVATRARESVADEGPLVHEHGPSRSRRRTLASALAAGLALAGAVAVGVAWVVGGGTPSPHPEPSAPTTAVVPPGSACPDGMVLVAGARFEMGSELGDETPTDETPRHAEDVAAYCLDVREVSVAAYAACRGCGPAPTTVDWEGLTPRGRSFWSRFCNGTRPDRQDHPINCVDWHQAKAYCASRGARLPTEAEWELAARGGDGRLYPWGDAPPSRARLNACGAECGELLSKLLRDLGKDSWPAMYAEDDGAGTTAPGGSFPEGASPAGVLDMAGNVWEWTDSAYCPYTRGDCGESRRVLRGGGWDMSDASGVRVTRRYPAPPTGRGYNNGFRCAADVAR